jgi:hypothetical protein
VIVEHLTGGGTIEFAIAIEVRLSDGQPTDLRLRSARRLAEHAAVLAAQTAPNTQAPGSDRQDHETAHGCLNLDDSENEAQQ